MAGERLDFDIFARLREDGFAKAAKAAEGASGEVIKLAERLDKLGAKSTEARVKLTGNKEALAQLDALQLKMLKVGDKIIDPEIDIKGVAKAVAELSALDASLSKLDKTSAGATGSIGGLAGPAGMGALIGAGVALSPVIATVAVGVGAFGLAAAGAVAPIVKAAQATGGLKANMAALDPEQRKLAGSVLVLEDKYKAFSKSLEPQALAVFGKGIQLAGHLMHDVQPIATATGKALGGMLDAINKEFASGTWQKFFSFMARTAGPDIALITANFTDFMDLLPPLLEDLQPLAVALLQTTDAALKLVGAVAQATGAVIRFTDAERHLASEAHNSGGFLGELVHAAERAAGSMIPGASAGQKLAHAISASGDASTRAASGIDGVVSSLSGAVTAAKATTAALYNLASAEQKNVDNLLTLQGGILGWQQSLQAADKQLASNTAGLKGNSANALANKAALLQTTQQAEQFAESQDHVGGNIKLASKVIQDQIHWLEIHGGKSKFATAEIHALRMEEQKLHDIQQKIKVSATGSWTIQTGGVPQTGTKPRGGARGLFIRTGQPGVDDQLIVAQRGELVVPTAIVKAGLTDHLRGMIPGFATGGVVGNYSGSVGGAAKWLAAEDAATLRALDAATAKATVAGIRSAQAAASGGGPGMPGPGGGAPSANAALARKLYPPWGSGAEWAAWNTLEMHEAGWNQFARNASGAYGIPQALPASKMGAAANPPQSNPTAQINWMVSYIKGRYGDPINAWANYYNHPGGIGWYAQGGVVGGDGKKKPVDPQRQKWLAQLARDVKVLEEDQKHAAKRRKILRHSVEIDELWFLTHPNVRKHGIGFDEHERALRNDRRRLSHFNNRESDKEKALGAKIAILRDLTGFPKGAKYGGPGVPAPDPGAGDGSGGAGGGDGGGGVTTPPAPPPIPPPPMPSWMVAAGLGDGMVTAQFPGQAMPGQGAMGWPAPVTPGSFGDGSRGGWGAQGGDIGDLIGAIRAMHQDVVGAVGRVAPGTTRGMDRNLNSMAARTAGRFT